MNNLEYFEKGLISAIEDYNEKYSSFVDGFFSSFTEDDIIKLGGWKNIVSAVGKVFKKEKPGFNIISPQRVIKGVEEGGRTLINPKALRKGQYMTAKEPARKVYKPTSSAPTAAPTAAPAAPAAPEVAPVANKSNFGKGLKWGIGGLGAGVAATSVYNSYKNRGQQQEPYYGY